MKFFKLVLFFIFALIVLGIFASELSDKNNTNLNDLNKVNTSEILPNLISNKTNVSLSETNNTLSNGTKTKYRIIEVPAPKNITFEEGKRVNFTCLFQIEIQKVYHGRILNNISFIIHKGNEVVNFTLRGVNGKYACFPEGIFLISYYPDGLVRSRVLFLDYNLSVRWEKIVEGGIPFFEYYKDGVLIFSNRPANVDYNIPPTIYGVNLSSGEVLLHLELMGKAISNLKIFEGKVYYASYRPVSSEQKTYVYVSVYDLNSREYKFKQVQAENVDHYILGADLKIDVNERFVALAYYLSDWVGGSDLRLCVFTNNELEPIGCMKISATPWHMKLEGDTIYIEGDPNAYRIVGG